MTRSVALVTGGTRGIGLGIAQALAARGWDLVVCGVREASAVEDVLAGLRTAGGVAHYLRADVASASDRAALVEGALARFGRIDALVNNAGRAPRVRADLLEATEESFAELMATNLQGPYFLTQAVARVMTTQPRPDGRTRGGIVFITSVSAEMASPNRGEYCVSKAGLAMSAQLFAVRLAPEGIPVFEVRPGIIETDMTARVRDVYDRRIADGLVPSMRWGTAGDVGAAVASLLQGDLGYATGSVLHIDGGLHVSRL